MYYGDLYYRDFIVRQAQRNYSDFILWEYVMAKPGRGADQFPLRLPPGMRDQIKRAAAESGRSMNQEIVEALREVFPEEPTLEELFGEIEHAVSMLEELKDAGVIDTSTLFALGGRLSQTSDVLQKRLPSNHALYSVRLDKDVAERVRNFMEEWELHGTEMHESVVNNLVRMSLSRIENREEAFKIVIGEGDDRRTMEVVPPWAEKPEKSGE